jgi:hypothetical protein
MSDIFKEFGVDLLCPRYAGPTAAEVRMEREIARLRADNDYLRLERSDALAGGDALRADRRERIATAIMAALLPQKGWDYLSLKHAAKDALRYADALIEEIDKEAKP